MKSMKLVLSLMLLAVSMNAFAGVPLKLPIEGRLTLPDGSPMLTATAQVRIQIRSPGAENCLLYSETFSVDLSGTGGRFSVILNAGAGSVDTSYGWTFPEIFKNSGSFATGAPNCTSSSSYTPAATDTRNVVILVDDGGGFDPFPAYALGANAFSLQAGNSETVGGVAASDLLQTNTTAGFNLSQSNITGLFADASWAELQALIAGTSTKYAPMSAGNLVLAPQQSLQMGRFTSAQEAVLVASLAAGDNGKMWYNSTTQTMMIWNGIGAVAVAAGGVGTVTSVSSGNAYLGVATGGTTPVITANVGTTANTLAAGDDSRITGSVQKSGSTMTGALVLNADPAAALEAAPKQYVDAAKTAAQAYSDAKFITKTLPAPPSVGNDGQSVRWNNTSSVWEYYTPAGALGFTPVNRAGDTMTGALVLNADPSANLEASTKQYVNASVSTAVSNLLPLDGSISMTGQLRTIGGTNGAPGYSFVGDPDTGMFSPAPDVLGFAMNGQEVMTFQGMTAALPVSRLAIGAMSTTGPESLYTLSSADPGAPYGNAIIENEISTSVGPSLQFMKTRSGSPAINNDSAGEIKFSILDAGPSRRTVASLGAYAPNTGAGAVTTGLLKFNTMSAGVLSTRMVIDPTGNVGIGTTTPTYALHLATDSAAKPGSTSWTIPSDVRLKDIGRPFLRGLEALDGIQTVYFHYKASNPLGMPSDKEYVGIRAQDVQQVIPEAVKVGPGGYLHVTNDAIHWTVFNAVKELYHRWMADSEDIHEELAQLKARNAELEARLQAIESKLTQ